MRDPTLVPSPTATGAFLAQMSSLVTFEFTRVRNPSSVASACAPFPEVTISQPTFVPIRGKNHSLVIFVAGGLPDLMKRNATPKFMQERVAGGQQRRRQLRPLPPPHRAGQQAQVEVETTITALLTNLKNLDSKMLSKKMLPFSVSREY